MRSNQNVRKQKSLLVLWNKNGTKIERDLDSKPKLPPTCSRRGASKLQRAVKLVSSVEAEVSAVQPAPCLPTVWPQLSTYTVLNKHLHCSCKMWKMSIYSPLTRNRPGVSRCQLCYTSTMELKCSIVLCCGGDAEFLNIATVATGLSALTQSRAVTLDVGYSICNHFFKFKIHNRLCFILKRGGDL